MKTKLWINLFIKIAVIFAAFVLLLGVANSALLVNYFTFKQEKLLIEKSKTIAALDYENTATLDDTVWSMHEDNNFDVEIYYENGKIIYTTRGAQMIDFSGSRPGEQNFKMINEIMKIEHSRTLSDGAIIATARSSISGDQYLVCRRFSDGIITELRTQTALLKNSAAAAGEFVTVIAVICFLASLVWVFVFARKFSAPISEMSEITEDMANLNFDRKVKIKREDEIGKLGESINNLSTKLDASLSELRQANLRLKDEIELERQLDVMRRGFVANVSHELKTPLAIISGYAEGLKLNVNSDSKDEYCDTIIDEAERMNKLVLSILELSKYESAQVKAQNELFDIALMAEDMAKRILKSRNDLSVVCEIPAQTLVFADPLQTEQILKAYLENTAAHAENDGKVRIFCEKRDDRLVVSVYNSGKRIDPEIMPQIWQSFYRGDKAHSRNEGRFGLGLSIVAAIVKAQGQSCGVYNTDDGVCFWFTVDVGNSNQ